MIVVIVSRIFLVEAARLAEVEVAVILISSRSQATKQKNTEFRIRIDADFPRSRFALLWA